MLTVVIQLLRKMQLHFFMLMVLLSHILFRTAVGGKSDLTDDCEGLKEKVGSDLNKADGVEK